ncbi:hypothetical protein [Nitratifractor sp.]
MLKKSMIATMILLGLGSTLTAKPNMQMGEGAKKLAQMAGKQSPYYRAKKEAFPKDYFLVSQNLPFLVGVALFHPDSDSLKLDKQQLDAIVQLKNSTVPAAAKAAKKIKAMETELADAILQGKKSPEELDPQVEEIAKARAALTRAHLRCIARMRQILSPEQFAQLLRLASSAH